MKGGIVNIRGTEYGRILGASGVQGFFGEGYWFHWFLWFIGLFFGKPDSGELTFVAKTTTINAKLGNMPLLNDGITPRQWFPACVKVYAKKGVTLNAVGLSGPGAKALFSDGRWQKRKKPFFISFMAVGTTPAERREEFRQFLQLLRDALPGFATAFGVQLNVSCPNTGHDQHALVDEVRSMLDLINQLGIPEAIAFMVKVAVDVKPGTALMIAEHERCDGIVVSNAIKFGALRDKINWKGLFGSETSPLESLGGGGLSGKPLLPLVEAWVRGIRALGMKKAINAGGGILHPDHVRRLFAAGADSVFLGTIALLRPWRMRSCIRAANACNLESKEAA